MRQVFSYIAFSLMLVIPQKAPGQQISFDYGISAVRVFEVGDSRQEVVDGFERYLYDIGPEPRFEFEIDVKQTLGNSRHAQHSDLVVERYMLLARSGDTAYPQLGKYEVEQDTAWVYHGPVSLDFTRQQRGAVVTFTSSPHQLPFLNPDSPITFARPADFTILGFAYRFLLEPAKLNMKDSNLEDNAYLLEFMKP